MSDNQDSKNNYCGGDGPQVSQENPPQVQPYSEICGICSKKLSSPRVLSCLHVFCERCLERKLMGEAGDAGKPNSVISCDICKQKTHIGVKKMASLPFDIITTNIVHLSYNGDNILFCTSCTAKEVATSRCSTCQNLLCVNCNTAHKLMRCFEDHQVITIEELLKSEQKIPIHKAITCEIHINQIMSIYCVTCQELVCPECSRIDHNNPLHHCDPLPANNLAIKGELEDLNSEMVASNTKLNKLLTTIKYNLNNLEQQKNTCLKLINDEFQNVIILLEKHRGTIISELNALHQSRELKLIDMKQQIIETTQHIDNANQFMSRLLENANNIELLYLKRFVSTQLLKLINNKCQSDKFYSIGFETNSHKHDWIIKMLLGYLTTESSNSLTTVAGTEVGTNNNAPIQTSFDEDFQATLASFNLPAASSTDLNQKHSHVAEYTLQQLANFAENVELNDSLNRIHDSGNLNQSSCVLVDFLSDPNMSYHNLHELANNTPSTSTSGLTKLPVPIVKTSALALSNQITSMSNSAVTTARELPDKKHNTATQQISSSIIRANKFPAMQIRSKFGQLGHGKGQFNSPHGFCLGNDEHIIVADTNNHRIQIFDVNGCFKFQFGIVGKDDGQLWYPRKVAVIRATGKYVICDRGTERSRMQIFSKKGYFLKKIAIRYIDIVAGLATSPSGEIIAVDSVSPTVFVISETGELLRWFDCNEYMCEPSDIAIHDNQYYVCDFKGHNVAVFTECGKFVRRIGCEKITDFPNGIDISDSGDILIGDSHGNRFHVAIYSREGALLMEYECPHVKVSRCCGLKITSAGYIVTLAKNNHHVLVLDTLYIS